MRVLVTGGAGFIGSHIVDALCRAGHEPSVVDDLSSGSRSNLPADIPLFEGDVRDADRLAAVFRETRPQLVCHQAAQMSVSRSVRDPRFDADVNLIGLINVLDLSVQGDVERFVFASSGGVLYGDVFEPADEDHPSNPVSPYGISKWGGEKYLEFYCRQHGLTGAAMRYANVYGPRQNPHGEAGVVAIFCRTMLGGGQITINGDGSCIRDYVYVEDVARANLLALTGDLPTGMTPLNVGTAHRTDVNQLAGVLRTLCTAHLQEAGRTVTIPEPAHGPHRAGDLQSSLVSSRRLSELLGWQATVPLNEGLQHTVRWFGEHTEA
ncbi:MAG: NAD-dependent epimerase/dehydratase family protein [Planctomycetaceae bacterium]|nr:NAD-dependent epimerase/dehydratase family protein [Planctomycetaceae bacterium]